MMPRGPVYDLGDGTTLQDLDGHCRYCGKRLAETINDPHGRWRVGTVVCLDCGTEAEPPGYKVVPSRIAPGKRMAFCQLCEWRSMPLEGSDAVRIAAEHLSRRHARV